MCAIPGPEEGEGGKEGRGGEGEDQWREGRGSGWRERRRGRGGAEEGKGRKERKVKRKEKLYYLHACCPQYRVMVDTHYRRKLSTYTNFGSNIIPSLVDIKHLYMYR